MLSRLPHAFLDEKPLSGALAQTMLSLQQDARQSQRPSPGTHPLVAVTTVSKAKQTCASCERNAALVQIFVFLSAVDNETWIV